MLLTERERNIKERESGFGMCWMVCVKMCRCWLGRCVLMVMCADVHFVVQLMYLRAYSQIRKKVNQRKKNFFGIMLANNQNKFRTFAIGFR